MSRGGDSVTFGEWLKRRMGERGYRTNSELERATGLHNSLIGRWCRNEMVPQPEQLRRLSGALDAPMLQLLVLAGHLTREEARLREVVVAPTAVSTDILTAIEQDIELLDEAREHLRNQYQLLRRLGPELSDRGRTTTSHPRAATPRPTRRLRPVAHEGDPAHADVIDEMAREVRRQYEEGKPDR